MELQTDIAYIITGKVTEYQKWHNKQKEEFTLICEMDAEFEVTPESDEEIDLLDDSVNGTDTLLINVFNNWQILNMTNMQNLFYEVNNEDYNSILASIESLTIENCVQWLRENGWTKDKAIRYEFNAPVSISEM